MATSQMFKVILLVLLSIIVYSCCDDTKIGSNYYKGYIINRAEDNFKLGMIRFDGVFDNDEELESPARAIMYHVSDGNGYKFDLNDCVYFKIASKGKYQVAMEIERRKNCSNKQDDEFGVSKEQVYLTLPNIQLNLHNADIHREGPKHTRRKIIQMLNTGFNYQENGIPGIAFKIRTEKEFTLEIKDLFVRESDYWAKPNGMLFFSETQILITNTSGSPNQYISDMSITHDHTH